MPNHDSGAYFLTALCPVDNSRVVIVDGEPTSPVHLLREALQLLPTALQTPVTEASRENSPFARSKRTHFVRLFIIDDAAFNGRPGVDTIVTAINKVRTVVPGKVDQLTCPYLVMAAEFDCAPDSPEPQAWLMEIWQAMPELKAVFSSCHGFAAVNTAAEFAAYVGKCQVETTMPFHDYGPRAIPAMPAWQVAAPFAAALAAFLYFREHLRLPFAGWALFALALVVAGAVAAVLWIMLRGRAPFPAAPGSRLPDVLKALYLQQAATRFAIDAQAMSAPDLHAAFGRFVADHRPADVDAPTQPPGVVKPMA